MPVHKKGSKWTMGDNEYDTQEKANAAYMAYLDKAMGVKGKPKKKSKKKVAGDNDEDDEGDHEYR
jgi:hypothetical protein